MKKIILVFFILLLVSVEHIYSTPADVSFQRLREGNERFIAGQALHPNQTQERMQETAKKGQKPFATIIACSDSRVPVEVIFDQGVGDLFVVKVAGNVVDFNEIATIEYGTEHLGTPLVVVLGHTKCGAVTAVAQEVELHGNLPKLAEKIKPAYEKAKKENPDKHNIVDLTIKENVFHTIEDLLTKSKIISKLVLENKIRVVGAIYDIETGRIDWLGEHSEQNKLAEIGLKADKHMDDEKSFFTSKNFIYMGIFVLIVSLIATIFIAVFSKKKV